MFGRLKKLFEKKPPAPPPELHHPILGVMTCDDGLWSGTIHRDGRDIPFTIGGTCACPDSRLVDALLRLLDHFPEAERAALQLLCPADAEPVKPSDFTFECVDFLFPEKPNAFTFEFTMQGDPDAIWRVEFEDGKPKYTGRDD